MGRSKTPATHPNASPRRVQTDYQGAYYVAPDLDNASKYWAWHLHWDTRKETTIEDYDRGSPVDPWVPYHSGWPGARPLPKQPKPPRAYKVPEALRSTRLVTLLTLDELAAVQLAATRAGKGISAWTREIVITALAKVDAGG